MSAEDVAKALIELEDDATRERVRSEGVSALGELRLSSDEEAMVIDASKEEKAPEVAGYTMAQSPSFRAAEYASRGPLSPSMATPFNSYLGQRWGGSIDSFKSHNWAYA